MIAEMHKRTQIERVTQELIEGSTEEDAGELHMDYTLR